MRAAEGLDLPAGFEIGVSSNPWIPSAPHPARDVPRRNSLELGLSI